MKHVLKISGLLFLILTLAGCAPFQQSSNLVLKGVVETQILSHYSEVSGKILKLPIELGQQVKAGDVLAEMDDSNDQYALEQLKSTLVKKQAALAELKAEIDLATAQTQLNNAKIASAQADIDLTESQIRQEKDKLTKYKITALGDGTIISSNFGVGALVSPGSNLADIAVETEKYLVAYLPEEYLPKIDYGQELVIKNGKEEYKGTVSFIDLEAQYTPKDMQTSANKNKDSVKIKVKLANDFPLKVGASAELIVDK